MACVTICASSIAATAGDNQPLELSTSTHACIRRIACERKENMNTPDDSSRLRENTPTRGRFFVIRLKALR